MPQGAGTGKMRPTPEVESELQLSLQLGDEAYVQPASRAGVAHRPEGQAKALERAARYRGFTRAVPSADAACETLLAAGREGGLSLTAIRVLIALLRLPPSWRWRDGRPVVRISNRRLANLLGCSPRTVQRGLKEAHELGLVAIVWGPGNTRLPYRQDGQDGADDPIGIDLRPALVFVGELAALRQERLAASRAFDAVHEATWNQILTSLGAVTEERRQGGAAVAAAAAAWEQLEELRRALRAVSRRARRPGATTAGIVEAAAAVVALGAQAEALGRALGPSHRRPTDGERAAEHSVDTAVDDAAHLSSPPAAGVDQETRSTSVETHVRTSQEERRTTGKGWDGALAADDPAMPLLLGRWLADYQGTKALSSAERVEHEITARRLLRSWGVSRHVLDEAIQRHDLGLTVGAVFHVAALPGAAGVRSKAGLLVSLLQRPPGRLAPETFHRRPPAEPEPELGTAEALGLAARHAPSHRPQWVVERWLDTRWRKDEPIHHPRRCFAGFARKLEREQGRAA